MDKALVEKGGNATTDSAKESKVPVLSAKQVKTALRCEYQYYLEYVLRQKPPLPSEALSKGLEAHESASRPFSDDLSPEALLKEAEENQVFRYVYHHLPKKETPKIEPKIYAEMGSYRRVVIPDFLYTNQVYDLKTTSSLGAMRSLYSDDVIQLHYYWDTLGRSHEPYVIKLLLPNPESGRVGYVSSLFRVNISEDVVSLIRRTEVRILDILDGSKPVASPGKTCKFCGFRETCPYSAHKSKEGL